MRSLSVKVVPSKPKFFKILSSYKIMQDCWQENPDDRPMFENLRNDLKEMENQHQVKYFVINLSKVYSLFDLEVV